MSYNLHADQGAIGMRKRTVNLERVRALFIYRPTTGLLIWRVAHGSFKHIPAGTIAGTKTKSGHLVVRFDGVTHLCHRIIWVWMTGELPANEIDHEDLDGSNNRWKNLRQATHAQNNQNKRPQRNNRLQVKGVRQLPGGRYQAYISIKRRFVQIGIFDTQEEASGAHQAAAKAQYGRFARHR